MIAIVGKRWSAVGVVAVAAFLLCCSSAHAQAVITAWQYTAPNGEVYISHDGGVQWRHKSVPADGIRNVLLTTANGARFRSQDGGNSWVAEQQRASAHGVRRLLLTAANGARFRSQDGGESWIAEHEGKECEAAILSSVPEVRTQDGVALRFAPTLVQDNLSLWYTLPESQHVELALVDALGRQQYTVYSGVQQGGEHVLEVNTRGYTPGIYFVRLHTAVHTVGRKIVIQP